MNDEIKEILAYFEEYVKITDMHDSEPMLNWKDLKIVLDYITNLQHTEDLYNQLLKDYDELQERIEKAAEYLKSKEDSLFMTFSDDILDHDELIDKKIGTTLLNILNGRSDE